MTINTQSISSLLRQLAAIAAIVLGAIPATSLPSAVRAPLVVIGGVLLALEHYLSDPSTGNNVTPPTPPAPLPTAQVTTSAPIANQIGPPVVPPSDPPPVAQFP